MSCLGRMPVPSRSLLAGVPTARKPIILWPTATTLRAIGIGIRTAIIETEITITGATTIAIDAGAIAEAIAVVIAVAIEIGGATTPLEEEKIKISIGTRGPRGIPAQMRLGPLSVLNPIARYNAGP